MISRAQAASMLLRKAYKISFLINSTAVNRFTSVIPFLRD